MNIYVCVGSSCHLKGSRQVVETLQRLIAEHGLGDKVELGGTFCLGKCQQGVCAMLDGRDFSLSPETAEEFFNTEILPKA